MRFLITLGCGRKREVSWLVTSAMSALALSPSSMPQVISLPTISRRRRYKWSTLLFMSTEKSADCARSGVTAASFVIFTKEVVADLVFR